MSLHMPPMTITFDDGTDIVVQPKPRDLALAERDYHHDYAEGGVFRGTYATALAALGRMKRAGSISFELPETVDGLMDVADIEVVNDDADPEGKDLVPAPTTG